MVFFTCSHCGESIKKVSVAKHYQTVCRYKVPFVTCVDCLKDFKDNEYEAHIKCVTEEERYSAKGFVPKASSFKGEVKQKAWNECCQDLLSSGNLKSDERKFLETISAYENVPRKKSRFINFIRSSFKYYASKTELLDRVWGKLECHSQSLKGVTDDKQAEKKEEVPVESVKEEETASAETEEKKKKKKKRKHEGEEGEDASVDAEKKSEKKAEEEEEAECNGVADEEGKPKKKKKKKKAEEECNGVVDEEDKPKKKKKRKAEEEECSEEVDKAKKTEKSDELVENGCAAEEEEEEKKEKKKKKKKKQQQVEEDAEEPKSKKSKNAEDKENEEDETTTSFDWCQEILTLLTENDRKIPLKKLQKKILKKYCAAANAEATDKMAKKFVKKLKKMSDRGVTVDGDFVSLTKI